VVLLRSLAFNLVVWLWTALAGGVALPLLALPRRVSVGFGRLWSLGALGLLRYLVGLNYEVRGCDRVPAGGVLVAMKHQSAWDAVILPLVLDDPAIVVKRELFLLPIYGWYMARVGMIMIDRRAGATALRHMIKRAQRAAAAGRPIVIFPQGTRVAPGARAPYQPGVAALYRALSLPLVPVSVNSGTFWGRRSFLKRPGRIILEFLDPIAPGRPRRQLMTELETRLEAATAALEAEAAAAEAAADRGLPAPATGACRRRRPS
jgi:1-acyl-sn-glycerol-3-phosphate acyltransferase